MPLKSLEVPSRRAARFAAVGYDAEVAHPAADRPPIGGSDHLRDSREWPEQPGLADFGGERRVPGLRREEIAMLTGVSLDYYTRLEGRKHPRRLRERAQRHRAGLQHNLANHS